MTASTLSEAVDAIGRGELVVFPTETVYGLGADATNGEAVQRIYALKGRDPKNPLIIHCHSPAQMASIGAFNATAKKLVEHFLPSPLTMVLPLLPQANIASNAVAGLNTVALRMPSHPLALRFLRAVNTPIAAPSANPSGRLSPTLPQDALKADVVLDGGASSIGVESTIVDLTTPEPILLRQGGVTEEELTPLIPELTAPKLRVGGGRVIKSPGMLNKHYAPLLPLRINATSFAPNEAVLAFGNGFNRASEPSQAKAFLNLSPKGNLREAAANFYAMLAVLEKTSATAIAVSPIPKKGLGLVLNNRLERACYEQNE